MRSLRTVAAYALLVLVAACGGSDPYMPGSVGPAGAPTTKGSFTAVVSFGTSASDIGTYAPATSLVGGGAPPYFGGKFTTNDSTTGKVWVENLAARLGVLVTPAEVGFNGTSVACPAAGLGAPNSCTGYGQGGARITDVNGIGHDPATGAGALTVPLSKQIDNHLARFTAFKDSDLILVEGGLNDLFIQFATFAAKAQAIQAQAGAGAIGVDEANRRLFAAQTEAQAAMKQAALELAGYVRVKILAKGGKYVGVATIPDLQATPFGQSVPASARVVLTDLARIFNLWLREGLKEQPVRIVDLFDFFTRVVADPAAEGLVNATDMACDAAKISALTGGLVTDGSPLFCNATPGAPYNTLAAGASATTWFFADDVHPSTGGHRVLGEKIAEQLASFGWI